MPDVQDSVSERMVRRADLFPLQKDGNLAGRWYPTAPRPIQDAAPDVEIAPYGPKNHLSFEELEDMNTPDLGSKHICPNCAIKYYDLKKAVVVCPKCGAKPLVAGAATASPPVRKAGRTASRR